MGVSTETNWRGMSSRRQNSKTAVMHSMRKENVRSDNQRNIPARTLRTLACYSCFAALSLLLLARPTGVSGSVDAFASDAQQVPEGASKDPTFAATGAKAHPRTVVPAVDEGGSSGNALNAHGEGVETQETTGTQHSNKGGDGQRKQEQTRTPGKDGDSHSGGTRAALPTGKIADLPRPGGWGVKRQQQQLQKPTSSKQMEAGQETAEAQDKEQPSPDEVGAQKASNDEMMTNTKGLDDKRPSDALQEEAEQSQETQDTSKAVPKPISPMSPGERRSQAETVCACV